MSGDAEMKHGDFIYSCIGPMDDPISSVTRGYRGARLNHVGVVIKNARGLFVLEAFPPEVRVTNIEVYTRRTELPRGASPRLLLGRIAPEFEWMIKPALDYGIARRNTPYDRLYLTDEETLYCSELIVDMFKAANNGKEFFPERPMNFRDLATGKLSQSWIDYYAYFGMSVPEGRPGSNPGDLSLDPRIVVYDIIGPVPGLE